MASILAFENGRLSTLLAIILAMATSALKSGRVGRKRSASEPAIEAYRRPREAAVKARPADLRELEQVLREMRRRFADGDSVGYSELNPRFHQLIWSAARNETAARLVGTLKSQSLRYQYQTMLRPGRPARSL